MYVGINDNVYRGMEWCGVVIGFLFVDKLIFLYFYLLLLFISEKLIVNL